MGKSATQKYRFYPDRPLAESPAPAHVRVDPGSISTESIKHHFEAGPIPVFSTMALAHGKEAAGFAGLREGFSWNPQMDLLWALGYPDVILIADGFPLEDTKQGHLAYWCADGRDFRWWLPKAKTTNPRVISRRGVFAVLYELSHGKNPFKLSEDEFLEATQPRELSAVEAREILGAVGEELEVPDAALYLEALVGSSIVAEALCAFAEDTEVKREPEWRGNAVSVLPPMLRRIPIAEADAIRARLLAIDTDREGAPDISFVESAARPLEDVKKAFEADNGAYAKGTLQWLDGQEELIAKSYDLALRGDMPHTRLVFAGGEPLVQREAQNIEKYTDWADACINDYSTLNHPLFLPPMLQLLKKRDHREEVATWLLAHREQVRSAIQELSEQESTAKDAAAALKIIGK